MLSKHVARRAWAVAALVFVFGSAPALAANFNVVPLNVNMHFGQSLTLIENGSVKVVAECAQVVELGVQIEAQIRLLAETTVDGAFMEGNSINHNTGTLNTDTPASLRELAFNNSTAGLPNVDDDSDAAFVQSADGHFYIGVDGQTIALGVNTHAGHCSVRGVAFVISQ